MPFSFYDVIFTIFHQIIFFLSSYFPFLLPGLAQVTTNSGSGLAPTYTSLQDAITALNSATITSPVIITLDAANPQTAPAGGYDITAQGSAANTITINGNGNTITANPALTIGSLNDAIFKLTGADYVTIDNFIIQENAANATTDPATNNMTEFGVALFYGSVSNGARNNTIQNYTTTLNRSYSNSFGIYSNTNHTATDPVTPVDIVSSAGANSFNKFYSNTISNVKMGIALIGSGSTSTGLHDKGNDVVGAALATGNTITDWGGAAAGSLFVLNYSASYCICRVHDKLPFSSFF